MPIGIIYKIICHQTNECYIGSTTKSLDNRMCLHSSNYNKTSSAEIISRNNYSASIIERFTYTTIDQLHRQEGIWQKKITCVNKNIAGRTSKEYYQDNKEKIKSKRDPAYHAKWYQDNKEKWVEYAKTANIKNKKKITCECTKTVTQGCYPKHLKSMYHLFRSQEYPLGFLSQLLA